MSQQMEHPDRHPACAEAEKHETKLGHRGVGEDAFDVCLRDSNERGEESGDGANPCDNLEGGGWCGRMMRITLALTPARESFVFRRGFARSPEERGNIRHRFDDSIGFGSCAAFSLRGLCCCWLNGL